MRTMCTTLVLSLLATAGPAAAVQPAELIDSDLQRREVRFVGLSDGTLRFFDADRRLRKAEAASFVSLRLGRKDDAAPEPANANRNTNGNGSVNGNGDANANANGKGDAEGGQAGARLLSLADGQRLRGEFTGAQDGELRWKTRRFGELSFSLDRIHRVVLVSGEKTPDLSPLSRSAETGDDLILLTNGDTLTGFIEAARPDGLAVEIEGQSITLGWERVAGLRLPNPVRREPGVWLRLRDGSRLRVDESTLDSETFSGEAFGGRSIELPTGEVAAVDFAERHRLLPLGRLEPTTVSGGHVFGVPTPPRLDGARARLHAPLHLRFELPEGARRFAADAALDPAGLKWADLTLSVRDGQGERLSERFNADQPEARVNVALRDRTLILRLDEGANGPIRDRLHLSNAVLLIEIDG